MKKVLPILLFMVLFPLGGVGLESIGVERESYFALYGAYMALALVFYLYKVHK